MEVAPPKAHLSANPRLSTLHEVEAILRKAAERDAAPLTLAEIGRRMRAKRTRTAVIRAAVAELERHKLVSVGSKGAFWVVVPRNVWSQRTQELK